MQPSTESKPTRSHVKRGLRRIGYTQERAAKATDQSPALVSMVLSGKAKSQPCLDKLAELIRRESNGCQSEREEAPANA